MYYSKQTVILSEIYSGRNGFNRADGFITAEQRRNYVTFSISLKNRKDTENLSVIVSDNAKTLLFFNFSELKNGSLTLFQGTFDCSNGFAVQVNQKDAPLYFGNSVKTIDIAELKQLFSKHIKERLNVLNQDNGNLLNYDQYDKSENLSIQNSVAYNELNEREKTIRRDNSFSINNNNETAYDDEKIAEENYFLRAKNNFINDGEKVENDKLTAIFNKDVEPKKFDDEKTKIFESIENTSFDAGGKDYVKSKDGESNDDGNCGRNEFEPKQKYYYGEVAQRIEELFERFERATEIEKLLKPSKFVKIRYAENKFYVFGVVYEGLNPKYIAYGIEAEYSHDISFRDKTRFIPKSIFAPYSDGYFLMFQDAENGALIK